MFRDMRRFKQQLSEEKVCEVLTSARRGVLSVLGDEGYPYGVPINFVYDASQGEHGSIFFHAAVEGHKLDAISRSNKACFTTMDEGYRNEGEWWYYVNSVICFGRARLVEDDQRKHDALLALGQKYFPPEKDIEADISKNWERVNMVELTIEHVTGKLVQEK